MTPCTNSNDGVGGTLHLTQTNYMLELTNVGSTGNREDRFSSRLDNPLTDEFRVEAAEIADRILLV